MSIDGFSWLIEDTIAGMAHPGDLPKAFAALKAMGVGAVVTLTPRPLPEDVLRQHDLAYLHLPMPNFTPPLPAQIRRFVEFCEKNTQEGRPVAVHCLAGMGRTGTMLACYLVWQGMAPAEAMHTVRIRRPGSIETVEQEEAVFGYDARLARARGKGRR